MTLALMQKLLMSIVVLTTIYTSLIFIAYHDLVRPISKSLFNLLPGIIIFGLGIALSTLFNRPDLIFQKILPLKSGFAKGMLGTTVLPIVAVSIRILTILGSFSALIDKMWFYWRGRRLFFLIRMISILCMIVVAGNTLFKIIFTDQSRVVKGIAKLQKIGMWSTSILGALLLLVTIMAIPHIFSRKKEG
jgi:hypothetical protein